MKQNKLVPKMQTGTNKEKVRTAPSVLDRYKGGEKTSSTINLDGFINDKLTFDKVTSKSKSFLGKDGYIMRQILYGNPYRNDTVYVEVPPAENVLIRRKARTAGRPFTRDEAKYYNADESTGISFGEFIMNKNTPTTKDEYETLKRRFNQAWNL